MYMKCIVTTHRLVVVVVVETSRLVKNFNPNPRPRYNMYANQFMFHWSRSNSRPLFDLPRATDKRFDETFFAYFVWSHCLRRRKNSRRLTGARCTQENLFWPPPVAMFRIFSVRRAERLNDRPQTSRQRLWRKRQWTRHPTGDWSAFSPSFFFLFFCGLSWKKKDCNNISVLPNDGWESVFEPRPGKKRKRRKAIGSESSFGR